MLCAVAPFELPGFVHQRSNNSVNRGLTPLFDLKSGVKKQFKTGKISTLIPAQYAKYSVASVSCAFGLAKQAFLASAAAH